MKRLLPILFLLAATFVYAQNKDHLVPTYICKWENISFDKHYKAIAGDTSFFVVTVRNYNESKKEFLDYDQDTTGTLKYFTVYVSNQQWTVVPHKSFTEMMDSKSMYKDFVIFTEGLGKTFPAGVDRATMLLRLYNVDELFFDWPTDRPDIKPGKNIKITMQIAPKVADAYDRFAMEFQQYKQAHAAKFKHTSLLFHSMGNLLLMHGLKQDLLKDIKPGVFDEVILNAACVNQKHHKEWLDKLTFADRIYITINSHDKNLNGAKLLFMAHQLGETAKRPYAAKAHYVDFSEVLHKEHNYFLLPYVTDQKPYLKKFYADIFKGEKPQLIFHDPSISEEVRKYLPQKDNAGISTGM